jgi:hypothetical protein
MKIPCTVRKCPLLLIRLKVQIPQIKFVKTYACIGVVWGLLVETTNLKSKLSLQKGCF